MSARTWRVWRPGLPDVTVTGSDYDGAMVYLGEQTGSPGRWVAKAWDRPGRMVEECGFQSQDAAQRAASEWLDKREADRREPREWKASAGTEQHAHSHIDLRLHVAVWPLESCGWYARGETATEWAGRNWSENYIPTEVEAKRLAERWLDEREAELTAAPKGGQTP